jgi:hypothetical protein
MTSLRVMLIKPLLGELYAHDGLNERLTAFTLLTCRSASVQNLTVQSVFYSRGGNYAAPSSLHRFEENQD